MSLHQDVADAIGSTVASVNSAQVKQIWRRSFDEAFLPGVERSVGTLMEKVNTSLQQCSQEYVRQVQSIVLNCQQHSSKAADQLRPLVMELDKKCEVLAEQQRQASDALPRQVSSLMKPMLDETLKTLSDKYVLCGGRLATSSASFCCLLWGHKEHSTDARPLLCVKCTENKADVCSVWACDLVAASTHYYAMYQQ